MKIKILKFVIIIAVILFTRSAYSTIIGVSASGFSFTPSTVNVSIGDTIRWTWLSGFHTTTCDGSAMTSRPMGAAPWNASLNSGVPTFQYVITVGGTYNYKCSFHAPTMVGIINASAPAVTLNLTVIIEGLWNGVTMVRDTARAYLRNSTSPYALRDSAKVYLTSSGNGTYIFNNVGSGSYFIVVRQRNSIETWSQTTQSFTAGVTKNYDFTTASTQAFGNNLVLKNGKFCIYSGDVNQDGVVDATDTGAIDNDASNFATGYLNTDLDGNNFVDASDGAIADNNAFNFVSKITPLSLN